MSFCTYNALLLLTSCSLYCVWRNYILSSYRIILTPRRSYGKRKETLICCGWNSLRKSERDRQDSVFRLPRHRKTSSTRFVYSRENEKKGKICKAISIHQAHLSPIFWWASTLSHSPDAFSDSVLNKSLLSPRKYEVLARLFSALRRKTCLHLGLFNPLYNFTESEIDQKRM